jgi:hypothetical protein
MFKISNIVQVAKADRFAQASKKFSIYRFKGESKLRIDTGDLWRVFGEEPIIGEVILVMSFTGERWRVENISEEAKDRIFKEALKEGWKLYKSGFMPELDNLSSDTLGSVLFKVLHEYDLYEEGEDCMSGISKRSGSAWMKEARLYFQKYRDFLIEDEAKEYEMYKPY